MNTKLYASRRVMVTLAGLAAVVSMIVVLRVSGTHESHADSDMRTVRRRRRRASSSRCTTDALAVTLKEAVHQLSGRYAAGIREYDARSSGT